MDTGYILVARKIKRLIEEKSPLTGALFLWLLLSANFKDRDQLKRGELVTSIGEMREAMAYWAGNRKIVPTKDQIRNVYAYLSNTGTITTRKTTRGLIITILNYDYYQTPKNFETHTENHAENRPNPTVTPHDTECIKKENTTMQKARDVLMPQQAEKEHQSRHYSKKGEADSGPGHYSKKCNEATRAAINDNCKMIDALGGRFGASIKPYAWVQEKINTGGHPLAVEKALSALVRKAQKERVNNPRGFLEKIYREENGNFHEADARAAAEKHKAPITNPKLQKIAGGIGGS